MCGRFAQAQSREEYLAHLVEAAERDIAWDPAPIGRYNVAPGTKVLLLMNAMSNSISMPFTGAMRQDGGINRR